MKKHRMKRHTKIVLASLIVVGGLSGAVYYHFGGGPDARAERVVSYIERELELSASQTASLQDLTQEVLKIRASVHANRTQKLDEIMSLVTTPVLDQSRTMAMVNQTTTSVEQHAPALISSLAAFTDGLTTEQKQQLKTRVSKKMSRWQRWHQ